ncbi:MAG TPA: aldolase/citrate lyase family protein [Hyphomonadaceae bacterium]|nr:aldolase/citrate lyase family protein [Hyphomonadaceae bacterium]
MGTSGFTLAARLHAGETVTSGWCSLPYPIIAELVGREGFDSVTLDGQHGLWDAASLATGIAAVRQAGAAAVVRVAVGDNGSVSRALDFGADAIIAPMINTEADARAFAAAAKFPPVGERSWGPHRATMLAGYSDATAYLREGNDVTMSFAMIETRAALNNVEVIAGVDGIDALFLGPADLSIALSNGAKLNPLGKEIDAAIDQMLKAADRAGKLVGAFCPTPARGKELAARGVRFLAVPGDIAWIRAGASAAAKALKG